jgi:petrobactin synthase
VIRVHCFVSCLCESLKKVEGVDQRPFYFGVWDAEFFVTPEHHLAYHTDRSSPAFFCDWFERLYGVPVRRWYVDAESKRQNMARLLALLADRASDRKIMVMLDLFRLPERENKFNQDPFPHYVMLEPTEDPETWLMHDPDFRWEGRLPKHRILDAVASPAVADGYLFDERAVRPADDRAVKEYFETCLRAQENPFTTAVRSIVEAHLQRRGGAELPGLKQALREVPVLAIRKYAYEHGFAFFFRELALDPIEFDTWCDAADTLVKTYSTVQFRALKLALTGDRALVPGLFELLDQQHERELTIKRRLGELFQAWCALDAAERARRRAASPVIP